jgi:CYTH domain-containing protein
MQHVSTIISCFHCRVDELLVELRNDATINPLDYIVFFKGFKNMEIDIFLCDLECLTNLETPMSNTWLDFMHIHTFGKNIMSNKGMYIAL